MRWNVLVLVLGLVLGCTTSAPAMPFGGTFTPEHGEWLNGNWGGPGTGPAWPVSLERVCDAIGKGGVLRVGAHWQDIESEPGKYSSKKIDRIFDVCQYKGIKVFLVLGITGPRAPGIYVPSFYRDPFVGAIQANRGVVTYQMIMKHVGNALLAYETYMVNRYRNRPNLAGWQIEDEPFEKGSVLGDPQVVSALLGKEMQHVRSMSKKPILLTMGLGMSDYSDDRIRRPNILTSMLALKPNLVGIHVYRCGVISGDTHTLTPHHWGLLKRMLAKARKAKVSPIIAGAQGEPWENKNTDVNYKNPTANGTLSPSSYRQHIQQLLGVKPNAIWVDGLEFQVAAAHQKNAAWLTTTRELAAIVRKN